MTQRSGIQDPTVLALVEAAWVSDPATLAQEASKARSVMMAAYAPYSKAYGVWPHLEVSQDEADAHAAAVKAHADAVAAVLTAVAMRWRHGLPLGLKKKVLETFLFRAAWGFQAGSNGRVFVTRSSYKGREETRYLCVDRLKMAKVEHAIDRENKITIFRLAEAKAEKAKDHELRQGHEYLYQLGLAEAADAIKAMSESDRMAFLREVSVQNTDYCPDYVDVPGLPKGWSYLPGMKGGSLHVPDRGGISARGAFKAAGIKIVILEEDYED